MDRILPKTYTILKRKQLFLSVIHHNDHSTVYRARLGILDIVVKFARRSRPVEDLEKETDVYQNELHDLQGDCVPRFRGFFKSEDRKADSIAGCIVLDYCGEELQELMTLPYPERVKVMESAGKVHMTGLILRDFAPRNVLRLGDRYTLIDFHRVRGHDCSWDGDLRIGQPVPSTWDMQCKNIHNVCFDMRIWEWGCTYSHTGIYPDQETVTKLLPEKYTYMERNREVLLPWLAAFKTLQEDDPNPPSIDEYKKSMPTLPIPYEG